MKIEWVSALEIASGIEKWSYRLGDGKDLSMVYADGILYIGTANPMNLMTDPDDDKPEGGWELLKLIPLPNHVFLPIVLR